MHISHLDMDCKKGGVVADQELDGFSLERIPEVDSRRDVEAFQLHVFVRASTLHHDEQRYYGNFATTISGACDEQFEKFIYITAIAGYDIVGKCPGK